MDEKANHRIFFYINTNEQSYASHSSSICKQMMLRAIFLNLKHMYSITLWRLLSQIWWLIAQKKCVFICCFICEGDNGATRHLK